MRGLVRPQVRVQRWTSGRMPDAVAHAIAAPATCPGRISRDIGRPPYSSPLWSARRDLSTSCGNGLTRGADKSLRRSIELGCDGPLTGLIGRLAAGIVRVVSLI